MWALQKKDTSLLNPTYILQPSYTFQKSKFPLLLKSSSFCIRDCHISIILSRGLLFLNSITRNMLLFNSWRVRMRQLETSTEDYRRGTKSMPLIAHRYLEIVGMPMFTNSWPITDCVLLRLMWLLSNSSILRCPKDALV